MTIKQLIKKAHKIAVEKGFWDKCLECRGTGKIIYAIIINQNNLPLESQIEPSKARVKETIENCEYCNGLGYSKKRNDGELIALMHSELSEILEELRKPDVNWNNVGEELADLFIRGADYAGARELDLEKFIIEKIKKNKTRPHKHGKRF